MTLQAAQTTQSQMREKNLAPYMPGRSELKEFASRLRGSLSHRGANKLSDNELLALAAASHAHGLNPYLGEIWAIPGKGLMIGRAGWVKKINEKLDSRGIRWWAQYLDIRPNEYATYGIPADAKLAYVCELRRADQIDAYLSALERMNALGIQGEDAMALIGRPPVVRGIGYIGAGEVEPGQPTGGDGNAKQGYMSFGERCKKRAFAQACKEIVDLPFNVLTEGDIIDGTAIDASEYTPFDTDGGESYNDEPASENQDDASGHWINDPDARKKFWRWAKADLRLTEVEVHEALGVEHLEQYVEGKAQAKAVLTAAAAAKYGAEAYAEAESEAE